MEDSTTHILRLVQEGDTQARNDLYELLYASLRELAASQLRKERPDHTLTPTALVHETYLALVGKEASWTDQVHARAIAARAMRQILVDHARRKYRRKRGGRAIHVRFDDLTELLAGEGIGTAPLEDQAGALLDLDRALKDLSQHDERYGRVVECRVFAGLTVPETAAALDLSPATVDRTWAKARAYLQTALAEERAQ